MAPAVGELSGAARRRASSAAPILSPLAHSPAPSPRARPRSLRAASGSGHAASARPFSASAVHRSNSRSALSFLMHALLRVPTRASRSKWPSAAR
uniref:Uncharacterized protein n=1 Tax=Arundo donax TaxID=35708 RepID=A0A0A9BIJ2_ARUDO